MRIRVEMDVTIPLKIDQKVKQPGGEWLSDKFCYEKLPTFCYVCGRIGHIERHCAITYRTKAEDIDASLRAGVRRPTPLGGEQWLINSRPVMGMGGEQDGRASRGAVGAHEITVSRTLPRSVVAARRNLGVSVTRPLTLFDEELDPMQEDLCEVGLGDAKKRCRDAIQGPDSGMNDSDRREGEENNMISYEHHG
ncbi:hypothetical protein LINGRAHAP2_LOCUS24234 [Linum grandiflorum]